MSMITARRCVLTLASILTLTSALALSGCGSGSAADSTRAGGLPGAGTVTSQVGSHHPQTLAGDRRLARATAARALRTMPMPPGSVRHSHSPVPDLRHQDEYVVPSDPHLDQTTWWTVALSRTAFVHWLAHHHPASMHLDGGQVDAGSARSDGGPTQYLTRYDGESTSAHTAPDLLLSYESTSTGLAVRGTASVSARLPRPRASRVSGTVTSLVVRVKATLGAVGSPRPARVVQLSPSSASGRRAIAHLVQVVDGLVGSSTPPIVAPCPMVRSPGLDRLTFHTTAGTWTYTLATFCFGQVHVTRDGAPVTPTLDPGGLDRAVQRLVSASHGDQAQLGRS